ncbi:MAG TPA: hypothetical protein VGN56_01865 [Candidatus Paceibacterota bacterium]|jgi:hypothetical protein|nr:hypothetical protein [Candidatus Paceibacterota bacterium]
MIGKLLALAMLGISLPTVGTVSSKVSLPAEIIRAGRCLDWAPDVVRLLPQGMAMHPELTSVAKNIENATVVRPTSTTCGILEQNSSVLVTVNDKQIAMIDLSNEAGTHMYHLFVDLGADETGVHSYLGAIHIEQAAQPGTVKPL